MNELIKVISRELGLTDQLQAEIAYTGLTHMLKVSKDYIDFNFKNPPNIEIQNKLLDWGFKCIPGHAKRKFVKKFPLLKEQPK